MDEIFRRLRLTDSFTIELYIEKSKLVQVFNEHVDYSDLGFFSDQFEQFLFNKKKYKGQVSKDGFVLKRRSKIFDPGFLLVKAMGTFTSRGQLTVIETRINGNQPVSNASVVLMIVIYAIVIPALILQYGWNNLIVLAMFIHAVFMFNVLYFTIHWNVGDLKKDLEREIREWVK